MKVNELFEQLKDADFSFTKPSFPQEREWHSIQRGSMDKLIACGLAEKIGQNKYSLTTDGRKASVLGVKKWSKSITDKNRRDLIRYSFEFKKSWYNRPILKNIRDSKTTSTISKLSGKAFGVLISAFLLPIIALIVWRLYEPELIELWKKIFE